jgi:hypothetical protein
MARDFRFARRVFVIAVLIMVAFVPAAAANHSLLELLSTGPAGGNGPADATFVAASKDGTHVFFVTKESLVPADTDNSVDIYERSGGTTTLVSTGPSGGNGAFDVCSRLTLPTACKVDVSQDGSRVFFMTNESLVPADTDTSQDVYERDPATGTTTLLSTGPAGGNGAFDAALGSGISNEVSADGSHVFIETKESLVSSDTDGALDVYDRSGGTTTLVSNGPTGGNGGTDAFFRGASVDGTRVFLQTFESLTPDDTDTSRDVYEHSGGTTKLVSTGPLCCVNTSDGAFFRGSSADGTRVFFQTFESLTPDDTDTSRDLYERSGGTTKLVSTGPLCCTNTADGAFFQAASADGSRVFFQASESLVPGDTDGYKDLYERSGNTTTLVSTGPAGGNGPFDAFLDDISQDGARVFFHTNESLAPGETDGFKDVYERYGGATSLVSTGPAGGNGPFDAFFEGSSADGTHVFMHTKEQLLSADTDANQDVYGASTVVSGFPRPKGATPLRISLVPAYLPCAAPNRTHGAPLAFGSCNPPVPASPNLTVGTPDANGAAPNSVASVLYTVQIKTPPAPNDVQINANITDVRCKAGVTACGSPNTAAGADYTGEVQATTQLRITDKYNGSPLVESATVSDTPFPVTVPCSATANTAIGAACAISTTANAVVPGSVQTGQRAIWQVGQVQVFDGGPDGVVSTANNSLFENGGVFVP